MTIILNDKILKKVLIWCICFFTLLTVIVKGDGIIKSYDELKINDVLDPHSDFSLPSYFLTKFAPSSLDGERIKSLRMKIPVNNGTFYHNKIKYQLIAF